jgi:hypothetical protein
MSEADIQKRLWIKYKSHRYRLLNIYFFGNEESDWLSFLTSGYCWEIEVKCTKSDYKADFFKRKHKKFKEGKTTTANRFYYAVPPGLIKEEDLPDYAGLMYVDRYVEIIKKAPLLHRTKHSHCKAFNKMYYNYEKKMWNILKKR